jgi:hypothetical protein
MRFFAIALVSFALLAQTPQPAMEECGLGKLHNGHTCHCIEHTSKIQAEFMDKCERENPAHDQTWCVRQMPLEIRDHCSAIEHYGRFVNEEGEPDETHPMPMQCSSACKRSHCRCDDGPTCHIMHSAADDVPPKAKRLK